MSAVVDRALVLRLWDFSETSQTVALFCRERGLLRGLAKGARRERGRFGGGFETLTLGEVVALVKPSSELATLTEWTALEMFWAARRDLRAHRIALYMIDLVFHGIIDHDPHTGLFDALVEHLRTLESPDRHAASLLSFQWRLLVEMGYKPALGARSESNDGRDRALLFDPLAGGVRSPGVQGSSVRPSQRGPAPEAACWAVRPQTVAVLRRLERDEDVTDSKEESVHVERASRLLSEYLRVVLDRDLPTRHLLFGAGIGPRRPG